MSDPYKRDRAQDEYKEADKRLKMTSDRVGISSSPQKRGIQSPQRGRESPQRERRSPERERQGPERNLEPRLWKERGGDSPPSSNSLSSDIMKRLHPVPSVLSGNWCKNQHNNYPKLRFISQCFLQRIEQNDQQGL